MTLAVRELGMAPEKFWDLLWADWMLYVSHIQAQQEKRKQDHELQVELTRQLMALTANINRDSKKKPTPFEGRDFFKLSYDTQITPKDYKFEDVARRFGSKIKKQNGGD